MNNIVENNKLIAEFSFTTQKTEGLDDCYIFKGMAYHIEDLPFDTDWNWLMEVITKITTLTEFNSYPNDTDFWDAYNSIDRQATYNACVEFIKWYNQNIN